MNILLKIFIEHYEEMKYLLHPRDSVMDNIDKMISCGDPSHGGAVYGCKKCGKFKFVPFTCKSRFCPSCDNKYSINRTTAMSFKMVKTSHRHCVFTIDENLRQFFLDDRTLLNCLFSAVRSVVLRMFHKDNKSELFTPGVICVLHTFGRDLKWNPHIHCLITETVPVLEFIKRLIQHIPEKHFKQIRYYGIYARHRESDKKLNLAVPKEKRRLILSFNRWRNCIAASFGYDPLKCPRCGETMALMDLYIKHKRVPLEEMYEKVMSKARRCRSPMPT